MKREANMKADAPHAYGFSTLEAGLELDFGAFRFAASPFPLTPSRRPLPSFSFRVGYVQGWSDGATGRGLLTCFRFNL